MNEVLKAIRDRRSIRSYEPEQITDEQLQALLDAALQSPTARNTQQWHFSVVQNRALLDEFSAEDARLIGQGDNRGLSPVPRRADGDLHLPAGELRQSLRRGGLRHRRGEHRAGGAGTGPRLGDSGHAHGRVLLGARRALRRSCWASRRATASPSPSQWAVRRPPRAAHAIGEGKTSFVR